MKPTIIADRNIPFLQGVFDDVAHIEYLAANEITAERIHDADALIIRTRTICNAALLEGSRVKYIATATIGIDHIDTDYCDRHGILWTNAPGCNARSVAQYVAAAIAYWTKHTSNETVANASSSNFGLNSLTIGIIGYGHVGKAVREYMSLHHSPRFLICDPPLEQSGLCSGTDFCSMETIAEQCDIITIHVPLTRIGEHATYHMIDSGFFSQLKRRPHIINAARGGVIDEQALKEAQLHGQIDTCVIDCWENEPNIDRELMRMTLLSTPHIAGYSADGKLNATKAAVEFIGKHLQLDSNPTEGLAPMPTRRVAESDQLDCWLESYDIVADNQRLLDNPSEFELQRGNYPIRRETKFEKC